MCRVFASLTAVFWLSACASNTSVADTYQRAQDWELCYYSVAASSAYNRELAGNFVITRGVNCGQHVQMVQARIAAKSASDANSLQLLMLGNQIANQRPALPPTPPVQGRREYVSGNNRVCIYNNMGSDVAITVPALSFCPLSLPR